MKKILGTMMLCIFIAIPLFAVPVSAASRPSLADSKNVSETIYFNDGSYILITVETADSLLKDSGISGKKTWSYIVASGACEWEYTVFGSFTYTGSSATCTSASSAVAIYDSTWSCTADRAYTSGASAIAEGTFKNFLLTKNASPVLTCSVNGDLS